MNLGRFLGSSALVLCLLAVGEPSSAETPTAGDDPNPAVSIASAGVVEIETRDEDGDSRRTKIWIVSLDGTVYVRTTDSRWNANLLRERSATLHSDTRSADVAAEQVSDSDVQRSVNTLFAEKYGFANTLRNFAVGLGTANMWALRLAAP